MPQGCENVESIAMMGMAFEGGQGASALSAFLHIARAAHTGVLGLEMTRRELAQEALGEGGQSGLQDGGLQRLNALRGWGFELLGVCRVGVRGGLIREVLGQMLRQVLRQVFRQVLGVVVRIFVRIGVSRVLWMIAWLLRFFL
jgi:hypothetical protein